MPGIQRRQPGLALLIVASLALGIGATATVGSIVEGVLLRPLPFRSPGRLVVAGEVLKANPATWEVSSHPDFLDWQARSHVFSSLALSRPWTPVLRRAPEPARLAGAEVSEDFFSLLGLRPALGRPLGPGDFRPGAEPAVVLSHRLWQQRFGGDPGLVGKTIALDGAPATVAGILAAGNALAEPVVIGDVEILRPLRVGARDPYAGRGFRAMRVLGRLRPGVSRRQAETEMQALARVLAAEHPDTNQDATVRVELLRDVVVGSSRPVLLALLGAAALLLLIACVNAANVRLVQLIARGRELAVRSAVGADRLRLFRQLLRESLPLVGAAALLGWMMTWWVWDTFTSRLPPAVVRLTGLALDGRVLAATLLVSLVALVLVDLLPFLELTRLPLLALLTETSAAAGESRSSRRLRNVLVAAELAFSLALLIGAGLLTRSLVRLSRVDLGFRPQRVLSLHLELTSPRYAEPRRARAFLDDLRRELEHRPGIGSAAVVVNLPLKEGGNMSTGLGLQPGANLDWQIDLNGVSPGYFATLGIPLVAGRDFSPQEMADDQRAVVILGATAARRLWPSANPLGRRVILDWMNPVPREVVGVVGDVRESSPDAPPHPEAYLPYPQLFFGAASLVIHTAGDPLEVAREVREQVHALDADVPVEGVATLEQLAASRIANPVTDARILTSFAVAGLLLATIGVYGVTSFTVSQQRRDVGVRMVLGALGRNVALEILIRNARWAGLGLLLGLGGGYLLSRLLASILFEVSPLDPWTFIAMPLLLLAVALGAGYIPTRKALQIDPVRALAEG
ncbi:MAG TPA: ADOP family duplicated permease [Thermoanaerobaculia bacterium]|nr:ADOP family duplicated permease [Thermoanaerobaculia bacterium]